MIIGLCSAVFFSQTGDASTTEIHRVLGMIVSAGSMALIFCLQMKYLTFKEIKRTTVIIIWSIAFGAPAILFLSFNTAVLTISAMLAVFSLYQIFFTQMFEWSKLECWIGNFMISVVVGWFFAVATVLLSLLFGRLVVPKVAILVAMLMMAFMVLISRYFTIPSLQKNEDHFSFGWTLMTGLVRGFGFAVAVALLFLNLQYSAYGLVYGVLLILLSNTVPRSKKCVELPMVPPDLPPDA